MNDIAPVPDPRVRAFVMPTRIVWASKNGVTTPENLLRPDDSICVLKPTGESAEPAGVLLDFGREMHGGVRLDVPLTSSGKPARVRVRFGESVTEAMSTPNNDHAVHDYEIKVAWMGHTEVGLTGFRFVRIDLLDAEATVNLRAVRAVSLYRDLPWLGSFECSDSRLNDIWKTGAHTVHLCMQDYVWDGVKRDRLVWIGDLHPEAMVISSVFGGHPIVPATLDYQRERTPLDAQGAGGATGGGAWMNGISSYSLWWIIIQRDWYRRTGDKAYLAAQRPYIEGLLERLAQRLSPDGDEKLDGHRFLEWPTSGDKTAIDAGLQALMVLALGAIAEMCGVLDSTESAHRAATLAERAMLRPRQTSSKQATALMALAGMVDAGTANRTILAQDPYRGLSTFYGYYVLEARAKAGDIPGCLDLIRNYWGGMLDGGATTFWEGFELDWLNGAGRIDELTPEGKKDLHADYGDYCYKSLRHSLCHGWAAGPTAWLTEWVLGVTPAEPGYAKAYINPQLGGLQWAKGTVPTPHGLIRVECQHNEDGSVDSKVELPKGVKRVGA